MEQNNFMNSFIKTFTQSRMGIEDALGLELFCCLVYKKFTEYRETRFKSPTEKLTIRQYIVYQQPIHPPHLCTYQCKPHGGGEYGQGVGI